jgi:uncharacterized protein
MLTANEIIFFLKRNKKHLETQYYCSEIGLFGSFARNEQTNTSDIDILVTFKPETPNLYDIEMKLKEYLKSSFKREVDICTKKWIRPVFKPLILKEVIYA